MMKRFCLITICLFYFGLNSCIDTFLPELKQAFPNNDLNKVKSVVLYDYNTKNTQVLTNTKRILWYTDFLKDSTNYFKKESLDKERGIKAIYNLKFISELDTLAMSIYPSKNKNKIVMAFLDPYDSNEPLKFRRYNRFYLNDRIVDSIESILK